MYVDLLSNNLIQFSHDVYFLSVIELIQWLGKLCLNTKWGPSLAWYMGLLELYTFSHLPSSYHGCFHTVVAGLSGGDSVAYKAKNTVFLQKLGWLIPVLWACSVNRLLGSGDSPHAVFIGNFITVLSAFNRSSPLPPRSFIKSEFYCILRVLKCNIFIIIQF